LSKLVNIFFKLFRCRNKPGFANSKEKRYENKTRRTAFDHDPDDAIAGFSG
jgi:hypothetical protein